MVATSRQRNRVSDQLLVIIVDSKMMHLPIDHQRRGVSEQANQVRDRPHRGTRETERDWTLSGQSECGFNDFPHFLKSVALKQICQREMNFRPRLVYFFR